MARRSKPSDAPAPTFEEAEKTQVSYVPDFADTDDLDPPTLEEPVPEVAASTPKLRLPVPGEPDPDPEPKRRLSLPTPEPGGAAPASPPPPPRGAISVPVYAPETGRRGSQKLIFAVMAVLLVVVGLAFALAPDGRSAEELVQARRDKLARPEGEQGSVGVLERLGIGGPGAEKESAASPAPVPPPRIPSNPAPVKRRRAGRARVRRGLTDQTQKDLRYGFEPTERKAERRLYDNFDSSKPMSTGIPMLMVFTRPRGMNVEVDGQLIGMSPLIRPLPQGTQRVQVRVSGAGFKPWQKTVSSNEIQQFKVGVTMERIVE